MNEDVQTYQQQQNQTNEQEGSLNEEKKEEEIKLDEVEDWEDLINEEDLEQ